jgi:hypothetical protein
MGRRAAATVGLSALAAAVALVIVLTTDWTPSSSATPEPGSAATATPTAPPTVDARTARAQAKRAERAAAVLRLLRANGCWSGAAPAGTTPTHAVVTLPGHRAALVDADVGFGIWLEGDPGELHGFCP